MYIGGDNLISNLNFQDIQFKVNSKFNLIKQEVSENKGNLLAAASVYGLVIIGSSEPSLKGWQRNFLICQNDTMNCLYSYTALPNRQRQRKT